MANKQVGSLEISVEKLIFKEDPQPSSELPSPGNDLIETVSALLADACIHAPGLHVSVKS